jgi:hypothetical protein
LPSREKISAKLLKLLIKEEKPESSTADLQSRFLSSQASGGRVTRATDLPGMAETERGLRLIRMCMTVRRTIIVVQEFQIMRAVFFLAVGRFCGP